MGGGLSVYLRSYLLIFIYFFTLRRSKESQLLQVPGCGTQIHGGQVFAAVGYWLFCFLLYSGWPLVFSRLQKAVRLSSLNYVLAVDSFRPLVGILLTSVACGAMCPGPARPSKGALSSLSASMWVSPCREGHVSTQPVHKPRSLFLWQLGRYLPCGQNLHSY